MKIRIFFWMITGLTFGLLLGLIGLGQIQFHSPIAQASELQQDAETLPRTITVIGEGQVNAAPDIAIVQVGVQVSDTDPKAATEKAAEEMNNILAALKGEGIAEKDIQTSYYNVYVDRPFGPDGPGNQTFYQVSNNIQVTIRDLARVTDILGATIEAGANNINSIDFRLSDTSQLESEARAKAVDNAKAKAEELAQLNGVAVGEVVSISEVVNSGIYLEQSFAAGIGGGGAGPISPGDVTVTSQLQISYAILR
jgi:uncharacterized protein YggE